MMRTKLLAVAAAALLVIPAQQIQAQTTIGPGVAYHDDFDLGVGAWFATPLNALGENWSIGGDFTYFFPDIDYLDYFEINGNLIYSFPVDASVTPFALGGLNIARVSIDDDAFGGLPGFAWSASSTEVGLNLGGGIAFGSEASSIRPVVGAKFELAGGEGLVIFGGIGFPVGG